MLIGCVVLTEGKRMEIEAPTRADALLAMDAVHSLTGAQFYAPEQVPGGWRAVGLEPNGRE